MVAIPNRKWFIEQLKKENQGRFPSAETVSYRMRQYQEEAELRQDRVDDEFRLAGYGW